MEIQLTEYEKQRISLATSDLCAIDDSEIASREEFTNNLLTRNVLSEQEILELDEMLADIISETSLSSSCTYSLFKDFEEDMICAIEARVHLHNAYNRAKKEL